jgi:signal transduction histidine kinase/ligand-binding sensor domain-containing protein
MICNLSNSSLSKVVLFASVGFWLAAVSPCPLARALDPHRQITQYGHTAWRVQDGFETDTGGITQTPDGYIWVSANRGILRFDGVRFTEWTPPAGMSLPSKGISYLLGGLDGTLWIGTYNGLSRYKDGKLFNYTTSARGPGISQIIRDHTGAIWVTRYRVNDGKGSLCRVAGDELRCFGKKDGNPGAYGIGLTEDNEGNFWFACRMLCRWTPGSSGLYLKEQAKQLEGVGEGVVDVVAGPSGSLWASLDGIGPGLGVQYYSNGKWASYVVPGFDGSTVRSHALFVDRNQTLWVGTDSHGLYHIHDGLADHYDAAAGLSGNGVVQIYEDKEGNLWVATDMGLDLFRDTPVINFGTSEGLAGGDFNSVLALSDGSVLDGTAGALNIVRGSRVSAIAPGQGLPGQDVKAMFQDHSGRVWLGVDARLMIYEHSRFVDAKKMDGGPLGHVGVAYAITEDVDANIWAIVVSGLQRKLLRIRDERVQEEILLGPSPSNAENLAADQHAGIWIGDQTGKLVHYENGNREIVRVANGDSSLLTTSIFVASDNAVWAVTNKGLYRWKDGHLGLMDTRNGLPCSYLYSAIVDNYGSLWVASQCGLLMISAPDLSNWLRRPDSKVSVRMFDRLDGAFPTSSGLQPTASKSPDGRLWFASTRGIQVVDPSHLYVNPSPPPVHIEEIVANGKQYSPGEGFLLLSLTRDLEIRYTALSFAVPQRVRFRYLLQGQDPSWQDAGTRRAAFYTNLNPGHYRFHVVACNSDGVWNETGAELNIVIPPAFYQTLWFKILLALAAAAVLWSLYLLRLRQATAKVHALLGERIKERERIARELHDTLLQGFQGLMLRLQVVMEEIPENQPARGKMEKVLERADGVLFEGRERVSALRADAKCSPDLAQAIACCGEELAQNHTAQFCMAVVGTPQPLDPVIFDEAYRIGREALLNAFAHSNALRIEGEITYHSARVRMSIRDNGNGIDQEILRNGRTGHWGLSGMRERAESIGGQLNVWTNPGAGTEVALTLPSKVAYQRVVNGRRWKWIRRAVSGWR